MKSATFPETMKGMANVGAMISIKKQSQRFVIVNDMLHYKYRQIMQAVSGPENLCVIKNKTRHDQYKKNNRNNNRIKSTRLSFRKG